MSDGVERVQTWMVDYLGKLLQISADEIDVSAPFERFGLDSASVVGMTGDLSDAFGIEIDPTLAYDYPTIEKFAQHLAARLSGGPAATVKAAAA
jgi:acyl carrier protein